MASETIADIVGDMLTTARVCGDGAVRYDLFTYARRIEAAWKRERGHGNAAAMREALVAMVKAETDGSMEREDLCGRCASRLFDECKHDGSCWVDKVMEALTAPPRNCDRYATKEEAEKAWVQDNYTDSFEDWLFATAESEEGGAE